MSVRGTISSEMGAIDARWEAVRKRDPGADGTFCYAVTTTGIYCRPSCGSRLPRRRNVTFHATPQDAERAGFRPCKRCQPHQRARHEQQATLVASLCRFIEQTDDIPSLATLADAAGCSGHHIQRLFKAVTGVTPAAYARMHRANRLRASLEGGSPVTQAIYGAGFNSASRLYENADELLGMSPTQYRTGGADVPIRFAVGQCSLGAILVAATERGVCAILMGDDPEALVHDLERRFPRARLTGADDAFDRLVARVVGLVEQPRSPWQLPLDIRGTAFQQRVWKALSAIPAGTTTTYSQLAQAIGAPKASRAVAGACAANPIAVAIPCHRVVRRDGTLSGYRWGIERKRALLRREAEE